MQPSWKPTADLRVLQLRAAILEKIRIFFKERNVLEVETPLLSNATVTDPYIRSFETFLNDPGGHAVRKLYLQTSPEFAMKRLLGAGTGSIYQICKAFRNEESGRLHNPEFTMLEWYRLSFNHHQLMDEMDELLHFILNTPSAKRFTYRELFLHYIDIDPHQASLFDLQACGKKFDLVMNEVHDRDTWLQLLMSHFIEPQLNDETPVFVYDFPASQAALAKIRQENPPIAERFEVYVKGVELANGYHELSDAKEQAERFERDLNQRAILQYAQVTQDNHLLSALAQGFPECAGVALGIDRLVMLATHQNSLAEVMAFPVEEA